MKLQRTFFLRFVYVWSFILSIYTCKAQNTELDLSFRTIGSYECTAIVPVLEKELRIQLLDSGGTVLFTDFLKKGFGYNKRMNISRLEINRYYIVFKDDKHTHLFAWDCGEIVSLLQVKNTEIKKLDSEYTTILKG